MLSGVEVRRIGRKIETADAIAVQPVLNLIRPMDGAVVQPISTTTALEDEMSIENLLALLMRWCCSYCM